MSGFTWKGHIEVSILGKVENSSNQMLVMPKIGLAKNNMDGGGKRATSEIVSSV